MKFVDNLGVAAGSLRGNPLRSFLTTLGVVIGVSAVIIMVSIGEGAKAQVTSQVQALGSNLLMITAGRRERGAFGSGKPLTNDILPAIQACPSLKNVAPEASGQESVSCGGNSMTTSVTGTTDNYAEVRNLTLARGSFFGPEDVRLGTKVAIIGNDVVTQLFPATDPIGQRIKLGNVRLTVIGTLTSKGQTGFMSNDDVIYVPLKTAQRRLFGNDRLRMVYAQAASDEVMDKAAAELDAALLAALKDQNAYNIGNQAEILSTVQEMTGTLTLLLAGIAGVSLLVGGIGIMNIMLVSVTERIKEIGIRKAIGAREGEILGQFLLESAALSLIGGVIGILLGGLGAFILARVFGWRTVISSTAVFLAFGLSLAIGLFFGVFPARKASRLDPIVALRHE